MQQFGLFKLEGERFDRLGMPVEALDELLAYREIIVEVAKLLYLRYNPDRQRVPRGFENQLALRVTDFQEGSASATLVRVPTNHQFHQDEDSSDDDDGWDFDVFDFSRNAFNITYEAISVGNEPPIPINRKLAASIARLGKGLRGDEKLVLGDDPDGSPKTFVNERRRKRFKDLASSLPEFDWTVAVGSITQLDTGKQTCVVRTSTRHIRCKYPIWMAGIVREHLADEETLEPTVALYGMGTLRADGSPEFIESAQRIVKAGADADKDAIHPKLALLRKLEPGWAGMDSIPPTTGALAKYESFLATVGYRRTTELEPIALENGGIRMEWANPSASFVAEIEASGGMYFCRLPNDGGDDRDAEVAEFSAVALARFFAEGTWSE